MAPPKKSRRSGTTTSNSKSNANTNSTDLQSLSEVLTQVLNDPTKLASFAENGCLLRMVWPTIRAHPEEEKLNDAALLFAILVNCRSQDKLSFLVSHHSIDKATAAANNNNIDNNLNEKEINEIQYAWNVTLRALFTRSDLGAPTPCSMSQHNAYNYKLECERLQFLTTAFQNLDIPYNIVSNGVLPIVGVQLYEHMHARRRELELAMYPMLQKVWNQHIEAAEKHKSKKARLLHHASIKITYVADVLVRMLDLLEASATDNEGNDMMSGEGHDSKILNQDQLKFLYRSLELFADLLSSRQTGRWLRGLLLDYGFTIRASFSSLAKEDKVFRQLLEMVMEVEKFDINAQTYINLPNIDDKTHVHILQKVCYKLFPDKLEEFAYAGVESAARYTFLEDEMNKLDDDELQRLCFALRLVDNEKCDIERKYLIAIICYRYSSRSSELQKLANLPIFPSDAVLWDLNQIPPENLFDYAALALPKLNLQFLSFFDYVLRNFKLYRLESAHGIRSDLAEVAKRVKPVIRNDKTLFQGWSRKAIEITDFEITHVKTPKLGSYIPSEVIATFSYDLSTFSPKLQEEWDEAFRENDAIFLMAFDATKSESVDEQDPAEDDSRFPSRYGIVGVRGCTIVSVADSKGTIISGAERTWQEEPTKPEGTLRYIKVLLDPAQYANDVQNKNLIVYERLNLAVRRDARTNNFHSLLSTLVNILSGAEVKVPLWIENILLGYGDPSKCKGGKKPDILDFSDTFLDLQHLLESFPEYEINTNQTAVCHSDQRSNYKVKIREETKKLDVIPYPFPAKIVGNDIRFTPKQVDAIKSGGNPGLTLIVGPPGTGKTDVAVQIVANLYQTNPEHKTLIITHSNAALNDIFSKVMVRGDIPPRYLLRLGSGERSLKTASPIDETDEAYSKAGRVAHTLHKRNELLSRVQELSISLKVTKESDSAEYTCETSAYFYLHHVQSRIEIFEKKVREVMDNSTRDMNVADIFPFTAFFKVDGQESVTLSEARSKFMDLRSLFEELKEYRPLELLRTQKQRVNYLLTKQAKVIAMTCTHASMIRQELLALDFQYDSIVMEEAGQMLEIETFIPLLLQKPSHSKHLKRLVLIGDHHQLPPVVKNRVFQQYSRFDQSMFTRFIRLGVPAIQLNEQGRTRPEIANLYNWRYNGLNNLDRVVSASAYEAANAGFAHTFQFVDVPDYQGRGENCPTPFFYQNLGEAEYVVALFQYMLLIGYPAKKISILTTYQGQRSLLEDIISQRCGPSTYFAGSRPASISTVDQYQGQQNDFILLSFVRTSSVGYMRDIRRLVVATSRARYGFYAFGRREIFNNCHDLKQTMDIFNSKPCKLQLIQGEHFNSTNRKACKLVTDSSLFEVEDVETLGTIVYSMQQEE